MYLHFFHLCFFLFICILHSVLDWKPCVLLTDWNDEGHATITLHNSLLYISYSSSSSSSPRHHPHAHPPHLGHDGGFILGRFIWQERLARSFRWRTNLSTLHHCTSTLYFAFCIWGSSYFVFCICGTFCFLFCICGTFSLLFCCWGTFSFIFICTTFSFVFCICCNKYSVISQKLDDSVKYILKTKTASLHGWSRIQKSLLKRMHWNSEQRIFWGKNYLIFELHWNSEPCKVQRRKRAVKILHQQCREFHCGNVNVSQVLKLFWFDTHQ